jgi:hypothetical protein
MPTTVFVIAASYLFARSSPALDRRLRASRWFGPPLRRFLETGGMPARAKAAALLSMWTGVSLSTAALAGRGAASLLPVVLGIAGTATIVLGVRTVRPVAPGARR